MVEATRGNFLILLLSVLLIWPEGTHQIANKKEQPNSPHARDIKLFGENDLIKGKLNQHEGTHQIANSPHDRDKKLFGEYGLIIGKLNQHEDATKQKMNQHEDAIKQNMNQHKGKNDVTKEKMNQHEDAIKQNMNQHEGKNDVTKEKMNEDVTKEKMNQHEGKNDMTKEKMNQHEGKNDVTKEKMNEDVTKEKMNEDVTKEKMNEDVTKEKMNQHDGKNDVTKEKMNEDVTKEKMNEHEGENDVTKEKMNENEDDKLNDLAKRISLLKGVESFLNPKSEPGFAFSETEMSKLKLWPGGVIPYYIDVISFQDKTLQDSIRSFLKEVSHVTPLLFVELPTPPLDDDTRWVFFVNRRGLLGCSDHTVRNFTNKGVQHVVLGYDCMISGGELDEAVLAIAGVPAQHNSPDRDHFVKVVEENIEPDKLYLYEKFHDTEWLFHELYYDMESAGHYSTHRYSKNGRATIEPQQENIVANFDNPSLSVMDIKKIQMLYNHLRASAESHGGKCNKLVKLNSNNCLSNNKVVLKAREKPDRYLGKKKSALKLVQNVTTSKSEKEKVKTVSEIFKGQTKHRFTFD